MYDNLLGSGRLGPPRRPDSQATSGLQQDQEQQKISQQFSQLGQQQQAQTVQQQPFQVDLSTLFTDAPATDIDWNLLPFVDMSAFMDLGLDMPDGTGNNDLWWEH